MVAKAKKKVAVKKPIKQEPAESILDGTLEWVGWVVCETAPEIFSDMVDDCTWERSADDLNKTFGIQLVSPDEDLAEAESDSFFAQGLWEELLEKRRGWVFARMKYKHAIAQSLRLYFAAPNMASLKEKIELQQRQAKTAALEKRMPF